MRNPIALHKIQRRLPDDMSSILFELWRTEDGIYELIWWPWREEGASGMLLGKYSIAGSAHWWSDKYFNKCSCTDSRLKFIKRRGNDNIKIIFPLKTT